MMVPLGHAMASAKGATNLVSVRSANLADSCYVGPGAGRFPTANSVINDILRTATGASPPPFPLQRDLSFDRDFTAKFYVRFTAAAGPGDGDVAGALAEIALKHGTEWTSVVQKPAAAGEEGGARTSFMLHTGECRHSQVQAMVGEIAALDAARGPAPPSS